MSAAENSVYRRDDLVRLRREEGGMWSECVGRVIDCTADTVDLVYLALDMESMEHEIDACVKRLRLRQPIERVPQTFAIFQWMAQRQRYYCPYTRHSIIGPYVAGDILTCVSRRAQN